MKRICAAVLILILTLCACSGQQQGDEPGVTPAPAATEGGTLSVGVYNFDTYNPIATQSQSMTQVSAFIYDGLMRKNSDYTMSPCLAESYTVSDNGLTYTFSLRQDVTWHDGSGFDANDVDYTIRMIQELDSSPYKDRLANVSAARRADKYTYIITLREANAGFINLMDFPIIKNGTDCTEGLKEYIPVGTGAYQYTPSDMSRSLRLVRNENYTAGEKPLIEEVIIKQVPDKAALTTALEVREVSAVPFTAQELMNYNPRGNLYTVSYPNNNLTFLGINTTRTVLSDAGVRRALSYAIGREEIEQNIMFGRGESVHVPTAPNSYLYKDIYRLEESADRAAELLTEAGYSAGADGVQVHGTSGEALRFNLLVNSDNERRTAIAEAIKTDLQRIGVEVTVEGVSFEEYQRRVNAGNYDMFLGEVKIGADLDLSMFAGQNARYSVYASERIDSLLWNCKNAVTQEAFAQTYQELEEAFLEEMPIISLLMGMDAMMLNDTVQGVETPAEGSVFAGAAGWYITSPQATAGQ